MVIIEKYNNIRKCYTIELTSNTVSYDKNKILIFYFKKNTEY